MVWSLQSRPKVHPHDCVCRSCVHCPDEDGVGLPPAPPLCDPCWGHGGAKAMTYKDYLEGHVSPPESSSGSSEESNIASRFPTHNDFYGPTIDDVFVQMYNFNRNHPPPIRDCVKPNCKCAICHGKCSKETRDKGSNNQVQDQGAIKVPGCDDGSCPKMGGGYHDHHDGPYGNDGQHSGPYNISDHNDGPYGNSGQNNGPYGNSGQTAGPYGRSGQNNGPYGNTGQNAGPYGSSGQNSGPYGSSRQDAGPYGNNNQNNGPQGNSGTEKGGNNKKKPKYCYDNTCGRAGWKGGNRGDEGSQRGPLGPDECDETNCGLEVDPNCGQNDDEPWGMRDAFGVGIDEALLALLSQFGGWFKKRKKKKKKHSDHEGDGKGKGEGDGGDGGGNMGGGFGVDGMGGCKCSEHPYIEDPHGSGGIPKFEKGPLDIVHWLHQEFLSLGQDIEDSAGAENPDTDGPLAPKVLEQRVKNLDAISELLTEKRGLEQTGAPDQLARKRSRAASHFAEADVASMGVKPKVVDVAPSGSGAGGPRKSIINWEDAHADRRQTRASVSHNSMMGPRKSVVLRPKGQPSSHEFVPRWTPPAHEFDYDHENEVEINNDNISIQSEAHPRSILHHSPSESGSHPSHRHISVQDKNQGEGSGSRRRSSKPSGEVDYDQEGSGSRRRSSKPSGGVDYDDLRNSWPTPDALSSISHPKYRCVDDYGSGSVVSRKSSSSPGKHRRRSSCGSQVPFDDFGSRRSSSRKYKNIPDAESVSSCHSSSRRRRRKSSKVDGTREIPGDEDVELRELFNYKARKHQSPQRPTSIVEFRRTTTESYKPNRRGLFEKFGRSRPVPVDVEVESTQTIWQSNNFPAESYSDENRAEKPYVEMMGGCVPCDVSSSMSTNEAPCQEVRVHKNTWKQHGCSEDDWCIDPEAALRSVNTQFPSSSRRVKVSATCNEETTTYRRGTDKTTSMSTPQVLHLPGVSCGTSTSMLQNLTSCAEEENSTSGAYVVRNNNDNNYDLGCQSYFDKRVSEFNSQFPAPQKRSKVVILRRTICRDDDCEERDEDEQKKSKKKKKRKDDDEEDEEEEEDRRGKKQNKGRKNRMKSQDDEETTDDYRKGKRKGKEGKTRSEDEESGTSSANRRKSKKRKDSKKSGKISKSAGNEGAEDDDNEEKKNKKKGADKKKNVNKKKKKKANDDESDSDDENCNGNCVTVSAKRLCLCNKVCKTGNVNEDGDGDGDKVFRVVRAVKKGNKTKIVPVITKVETLGGTKRRAILEWDDACPDNAASPPAKEPCSPKKCVKEVLWAVTKITIFTDGTKAYEVKKPTKKTPTGRIPAITDMLFMVQTKGCVKGGVVMYDKTRIDAMRKRGQCNTEGMKKTFEKTELSKYRICKYPK